MKAKELQEALGKMDPNTDVLGYCEDDDKVTFFELLAVEKSEMETERQEDGTVKFTFGKTEYSRTFTLLEVTTNF